MSSRIRPGHIWRTRETEAFCALAKVRESGLSHLHLHVIDRTALTTAVRSFCHHERLECAGHAKIPPEADTIRGRAEAGSSSCVLRKAAWMADKSRLLGYKRASSSSSLGSPFLIHHHRSKQQQAKATRSRLIIVIETTRPSTSQHTQTQPSS